MIRPDGYVKVLDFGLAKLADPDRGSIHHRVHTREGAVVGTFDYMAPEQANGQPVDARADLYSLSVVLYEMVTGVLPRELGSGSGDATSAARAVPPALMRVLQRGVASDPAKRHQTADELNGDLNRVQQKAAGAQLRSGALRWALAAGVVVALGGALLLWNTSRRGPDSESTAADAADPIADVTTLAVLPFRALTTGADDQYLGFGLADAVITQLGEFRQLQVRPTASVREFTQPDLDPLAAGRKLGVDHVLSGVVQRDGDRVRVTVQLVDVATGVQRWSSRIDVQSSDLFTLQDAVSERVVSALGERMGGEDRKAPAPAQTSNPEAYQLYLQGRYFVSRTGRPDLERGLALFQQAIALDPRYARAHAGVGAAYRKLAANFTQGASPTDSMPLARQAALKALALEPDLPEALFILGSVQFQFDYDWKGAEASLAKAVRLGPSLSEAHRTYGWLLTATGRVEPGLSELRRAEALDPTDVLALENLAIALEFGGRSSEALEKIDVAIRLDPLSGRPLSRRIWMLELHQRYDEALSERQAALRRGGRRVDEAERLGGLYAKGGQRALLDDAVGRPGPKDPIGAAWAYVQLGDRDAAIAELERGVREKHTWVPMTRADPRFVSLHGERRFAESDAKHRSLAILTGGHLLSGGHFLSRGNFLSGHPSGSQFDPDTLPGQQCRFRFEQLVAAADAVAEAFEESSHRRYIAAQSNPPIHTHAAARGPESPRARSPPARV